jgi:hypothetical protein
MKSINRFEKNNLNGRNNENSRYLCDMKTKPVNRPSFNTIFSNAIASAKIEGIRFNKKSQAHIKKEALKKLKTNSR